MNLIAASYHIIILEDIGFLLGTASGALIGLARLFDSKLIREVYKKCLNKTEREMYMIKRKRFNQRSTMNDSLVERLLPDLKKSATSIACFGDLFESMSKRVINI